MKIILTLECGGPAELEEAEQFARALARQVERRQNQGFPGAILERDDASVWVAAVELVYPQGRTGYQLTSGLGAVEYQA